MKKKKRSKSKRNKFMSKSMMVPSLETRSFKHNTMRNSLKKKSLQGKQKIPRKRVSDSTKMIPKIQSLAHDISMEFSVPRNPNKTKEFSFEKKNSQEMIMADNFSFSEKLQGNLKRVKRNGSNFENEAMHGGINQKNSSGVFGSICSSIMNRYNSFIQVITFL